MNPREMKSLAGWLVALGEPTRVAIVRELAGESMSVGALAKVVGVGAGVLSHHIGVMRAAGVAVAEQKGRFIFYRLVNVSVTPTAVELTHESGARVAIPL